MGCSLTQTAAEGPESSVDFSAKEDHGYCWPLSWTVWFKVSTRIVCRAFLLAPRGCSPFLAGRFNQRQTPRRRCQTDSDELASGVTSLNVIVLMIARFE